MANSEVRGESGAFLGREEFSGLSVFFKNNCSFWGI